jgi:predicted Holliday junction resolvase-like endonuclease
MTLTDLLIPAIAFILGIIAVYLFFRQQISVYEERARNDLERWKLECTNEIRKDSVNRSRSTLKGRISEQIIFIQKLFFQTIASTTNPLRYEGNSLVWQ